MLLLKLAKSATPNDMPQPVVFYLDIHQWHSQNAEKVTNIKGRLLDQAAILFNWVL